MFDNFYAHVGLTANSLAALSLSVYPYMTWREYTQEYPDLPGDTLADVLRPRGYRTAFLTSGFLDYVGMDRFLQNRGFDEVRDWNAPGGRRSATNSWGGERCRPRRPDPRLDRPRPRRAPSTACSGPSRAITPTTRARASRSSTSSPGGPLPPDDYDLGRYLNTLADVDRQLGRLFDGLARAGARSRTRSSSITGDHGETFGEPHRTWGHGFRLYEESVHVPLMVWSPRLFPRGEPPVDHRRARGREPDRSSTSSGFPLPASWEGRSLFAPDRPPRAYFYAANDDYLLGRSRGAAASTSTTRPAGSEELYDLASDPDERVNVAAAHPDECRAFRARLAAWRQHAAARLAQARPRAVADAGWSPAGAAVR